MWLNSSGEAHIGQQMAKCAVSVTSVSSNSWPNYVMSVAPQGTPLQSPHEGAMMTKSCQKCSDKFHYAHRVITQFQTTSHQEFI